MILETKLQPPSLKPNTLRRERLLKLLKNNLERKLVLITGDAGYGKTTLLAQVIEDAHLPCVFYDLDKGDSDLVVFCSFLVHGLEGVQPALAQRVKGLLEQGGEVGKNYELLFGTLINELVEKRKEELFFVLDDYHALPEDSLVHKALDYFIDHLPDIVHVVIASRTMPPLSSLSKWRAKEDLFELSREGLKFTEEEVKALLSEVYKFVISEEEVKRVSEQTEGWITGIRLILQSAGKDGKTIKETLNGYLEANQPLFEYFANEILASETLEAQDFLRKSSVLDVMTPEACDQIFGVIGSGERLKHLEQSNLFLSIVGEGQYKYHRLFREFLVSRITDEKFKTSLHLKAADYYQRKGLFEQTIEHYLEAGSYEWAGKVIVQVADDMIEKARFSTFADWLRRMPEDMLEKQPRLLVIRGIRCQVQGRLEEAEELYIRSERLLRKGGDALGLAHTLYEQGSILWMKEKLNEAILTLRKALRACSTSHGIPAEPRREKLKVDILNDMGIAYDALGDLKKAKLHLLRAMRADESVVGFHTRIAPEINFASLLCDQGDVRLALNSYRSLVERIGEKYWLRAGVIFSNAARAALVLGDAEYAERVLEQGWTLCKPYEDPWSQTSLHLGFGILHLEKEQWDQAFVDLEKAREGCAKAGWVSIEAIALRELARLCRYRGELEKAQAYLEHARKLIGIEDALLIELGLLQIALEQFEKAEITINGGLRLARRFGWKTGEFLAYLANAEIQYHKGKKKEAYRLFYQAIRLANLKGYDGILMRELRHSPSLLELARQLAKPAPGKEGAMEYLREILSKCPGCQELKSDGPALRVRLFGTMQLSLPDGKVVPLRWKFRKVASLFAYLLLHRDRVCGREELMEVLWPGAKLNLAEQSLYPAVSRLKETIASGFRQAGERSLAKKPFILHQEKGYRLAPSVSLWLDVGEFLTEWQAAKALEKEGKIEDSLRGYERCLKLYRDDFLPALGERWVEERREDYEKLFLVATRTLADQWARSRDHEEAGSLYRRYLEKDPYSEEVRREYWKVLKALGRRANIQKDFKELQRILKRDFGEEPRGETVEACKELMKP